MTPTCATRPTDARRSLLAGQRCSQLVTLSDPILPIPDHLEGLLVHRDALQLGQGNRKGSAFPADQHEHLVLALLLGGHPDDLDLLADAQRRDAALGGAPGHKREVQPVLEGVVPAHGLLFGSVRVDDDLHGDALLPLLVAGWSLHQFSGLLLWAIAGHGWSAERPVDRRHVSLAGGPRAVVRYQQRGQSAGRVRLVPAAPQRRDHLLGAAAYACREVARESAPAP